MTTHKVYLVLYPTMVDRDFEPKVHFRPLGPFRYRFNSGFISLLELSH